MYDETEVIPFSEPETENATKFHFNEIPESQHAKLLDESPWELRDKWRRFHGYNNGLWNGAWANKELLYQQDNEGIFQAFAGQIGLTRDQKERGLRLFHSIHYKTYSPYYRVVDIAFYVCVLVANEEYAGEGRIYQPGKKHYSHPIGEDHVGDPHEPFLALVEKVDLDVPSGKIMKGLEKFRHVVGL
jgi:hypothetical protein